LKKPGPEEWEGVTAGGRSPRPVLRGMSNALVDREAEVKFEERVIQFIRSELAKAAPSNRRRLIERFVLAALGSIPWVGGVISAAVNYKTEEGSIRQAVE
jgi:hypothetical protein